MGTRAESESVPESSMDKVITEKDFSFKLGTECGEKREIIVAIKTALLRG